MSLRFTIKEAIEDDRLKEWRKAGATDADIEAARQSGIDARDIRLFLEVSRAGMLFVVRCPKTAAWALHGMAPAKAMAVKDKTGESGFVVSKSGHVYVSDYDLMSIWKRGVGGWEKVFVSAARGAKQGPWSKQAGDLVRMLNMRLVSKIQHGCQDDFHSKSNPGVKSSDHFAAFMNGGFTHLKDFDACKAFYGRVKIPWPYNPGGAFVMPR